MKTSFVKRIMILCMVFSLFSATTITVAAKMDNRIEKSYHKLEIVNKGVYARGFVKARQRHYANVAVGDWFTGNDVVTSGRKWGSGKIEVRTKLYKESKPVARETRYYSRIYYGFHND